MDRLILISVIPLALAAVLYIFQAIGYQIILHRPGMTIAFLGYVVGNIGFMIDVYQTGIK
jgi:hypothetical protein